MKATDSITYKIDRLPNGYIFTYIDFMDMVNRKEAIIKALNRMTKSGKIAKLSKGKYYKIEITQFGNLEPDQYQVVKDLLEMDGKVSGYLTGFSTYNKLGLTTQISNTIQIGKNNVRPGFKRGRYTISFIKQKNIITKDNIYLLQILDAIKYIKKIPDASINTSFKRLLSIVKTLSMNDIETMVRLALKYPSFTRALLGTMLEEAKNRTLVETVRRTLNPITIYKLPGIEKVSTLAKNWNIK